MEVETRRWYKDVLCVCVEVLCVYLDLRFWVCTHGPFYASMRRSK